MPNDNLKKLYDSVSQEYELPDFATFKNDMADDGNRKKFYDAVAASYELPDYETFSSDVGFSKGALPEVGAASGVDSNAPQEPSSLSGASNEYQAKLNKMNFVQRFNQPEKFIQNKDGSRSTHKMASANVDNKNIAFPTIVEKNGKLIELSVEDAIDHAMKTGEFAEFATEQDAQQWAEGGYKEGTGLQPSLPSGIREVAIKAATGDPAAMAAMEWYKNNSNKKPEQKITGKITIADPEKIPFTERKKAAEFARSKGVNIPDYEKKGNETDVEAATRNVEYKNAKAQTEGLQNIQRTTTPEALSVAEKNFKSNLGKGKEEVVAAQDKLQTEVDRAAYDYIRSTSSPENAQYEISKYSTIANKKKNGEELTDAEIEYLFDTRKKSVSQLANESFAKAYETEQSGDFDEYAKDMAKINSIAKGLSVAGKVDVSAVDGYYKNYKTISDALKTSVESATSEYNSKIADIQKMYDNKEISDYEADQLAKEAKAVYDDAFNKYETDSKEVYGKYVSEVGGINEKLKQENNKQQANLNVINSMLEDTRQRTNVDDFKIEELNKQYKAANDLSKAVKTLDVMDNEAYVMQEEKRMIAEQEKEDPTVVGQFTKGFIRSLGGAVMNLGQLPQVITSALGDTDYSAEDVFADAIEEKKNNPVFRPLPKDAPEYLKAGYDLGSAVGSITSFAVGGQSKAAVAGIAFLTTESDAFREALETGMDRDDAAIYSSFISSLTALSEGIIPDGKYFADTARASVLRAIKNGKGVKDAISSALKELPKSAESYIETFGKEGLEEGTTNIIGSTGETLVDQVEGKSYYGGFDVESLKKDILLGAAAGGFMNAFRRGTPKSKVEESAAFDMVENRDYIVDNLEQVDPETATEVKEQLDAAKENLDALKTHSNWDKLSEDEKAHAFALTQQAAALKEQEKITAVPIEDKAKQEQIKAIEEELNTIFNEREEQTTTEEPQETTKIDGESEQQDLPTEGEATNEEVQPTEAERVEQGKKNVESKKADIERRRQEELSSEEYRVVVSEERLNDIANKVKNREPLSDREKAIFSDKTGEINKIIATKAGSVGVGGDVEGTAKALEEVAKTKPTLWEKIKEAVKNVGKKLGIISNADHINNFNTAKAEWDKLSSREKKLKRADYELDDLHHTEGGYYKVGNSLIDLDLNSNHLKLLLENNKFLNVLNKLGVTKIHGENRPAEEMFAHYSDGKIHLNNNSAFENIRQVTNAMSHELGHHEWTKLTKEERDYVRSLPLETGMAKHYEAQEKSGKGKETSASLQEENFADYVMQYFQGKLYGDEALLNKIPTKLRELFDNKYSDLLKDNEHSEIAEAYHKAKADGTNPELVKAVEQSIKETTKADTTTTTQSESNPALRDVENATKALPNYGKTVDTKMGKVDLVIEPNIESENKNSIKVSAYDADGNTLGFSSAVIDTKNKTLTVKVSQIKDKYQRNGIYSKIIEEYETIAKDKGLKLERELEGETKASKDFWNNRKKEGAVETKINEIAKKFKSVESELKGTIDVEKFSIQLKKRYDEINEQYGENKANEVLDSEAKRADKIIKEHIDSIFKRLKAEYFEKNGHAPTSVRDFKSGIKSGEYKIDDLPSYKDAAKAGIEFPQSESLLSKEQSKPTEVKDKVVGSGVGGDVDATTKALEGLSIDESSEIARLVSKNEIKIKSTNVKDVEKLLNQKGNPKKGDILNIGGTDWEVNKINKRQIWDSTKKEFKDADGYEIQIRNSKNGETYTIRTDNNNSFKGSELSVREKLSNYEKQIAEAYHKAKADGSNPELVKAVEQSLPTQEVKAEQPNVSETKVEAPKQSKKEFVSSTGRSKIIFDKDGKAKVVNAKTGELVSPKTRDKVIAEYAETYDFTEGERVNDVPKVDTDEQAKEYIVENTKSPTQLVEIYLKEEPISAEDNLNTKEFAIVTSGEGITGIRNSSFNRFGDKNNKTLSIGRRYLTGEKGRTLDSVAVDITNKTGVEVTPEDIVDFMMKFPNGVKEGGESNVAKLAKERFEILTNIPLTNKIAEKVVEQERLKLEKEVIGEPFTDKNLMEWLNEESQLTPEQETILEDNFNNILYENEQTRNQEKVPVSKPNPKANDAEPAKQQTSAKPKEKAIVDVEKVKKIADFIRKGKIDDDILMSGVPFAKEVWNGAVEAMAKTVELTGDIAKAIEDGIAHIKKSDWYKSLSEENKAKAENRFNKEYSQEKINEKIDGEPKDKAEPKADTNFLNDKNIPLTDEKITALSAATSEYTGIKVSDELRESTKGSLDLLEQEGAKWVAEAKEIYNNDNTTYVTKMIRAIKNIDGTSNLSVTKKAVALVSLLESIDKDLMYVKLSKAERETMVASRNYLLGLRANLVKDVSLAMNAQRLIYKLYNGKYKTKEVVGRMVGAEKAEFVDEVVANMEKFDVEITQDAIDLVQKEVSKPFELETVTKATKTAPISENQVTKNRKKYANILKNTVSESQYEKLKNEIRDISKKIICPQNKK